MFSATIPEKVYFKAFNSNSVWRNKQRRVRTDWFLLPEKSPFQTNLIPGKGPTVRYDVYSSDDSNAKIYLLDKGFLEEKNEPIRLKLVGFAAMGRPYDSKKFDLIVATPNGISFAISHDVFIHAIYETGLEPGGMLPGKYIFAKFGKTVKPVQIGSTLHEAILSYINDKFNPKIKIRNMQIGEVYATGAGNMALFLGFVNTEKMVVGLPPGTNKWFFPKTNSVKDPLVNFEIKFRRKNLISLWMDCGNKNEDNNISPNILLSKTNDAIASKKHYLFKVRATHSFNNKVDVDRVDLPVDIIQKVRNMAENSVRVFIEKDREFRGNPDMYIRKFTGRGATPKQPPDVIRHYDAIRTSEFSMLLNMVPYGMQPVRSETCNMFAKMSTKNLIKAKSNKRSK